jgi:hypothetical protein
MKGYSTESLRKYYRLLKNTLRLPSTQHKTLRVFDVRKILRYTSLVF